MTDLFFPLLYAAVRQRPNGNQYIDLETIGASDLEANLKAEQHDKSMLADRETFGSVSPAYYQTCTPDPILCVTSFSITNAVEPLAVLFGHLTPPRQFPETPSARLREYDFERGHLLIWDGADVIWGADAEGNEVCFCFFNETPDELPVCKAAWLAMRLRIEAGDYAEVNGRPVSVSVMDWDAYSQRQMVKLRAGMLASAQAG